VGVCLGFLLDVRARIKRMLDRGREISLRFFKTFAFVKRLLEVMGSVVRSDIF